VTAQRGGGRQGGGERGRALRESDRERRLESEQCATNPSQAVTLHLLFGGQRRPSGPTMTRAWSRTEPGSKRITSPVFLLGPGSSCTAGRVEPGPKGWPDNQTGQTWPSQAKCLVGSPTKHILKDLKWIMSSRIPATLCYGAQCAKTVCTRPCISIR
jgi:hypothetical protein